MFKFKEGDKVKVIGNSPIRNMTYRHRIPIGTIVTIRYGTENTNKYGDYDIFNYYSTDFQSSNNMVLEIDLQKLGTPQKETWIELKITMTEFHGIPENEADEAIELLKLKKAIRELTPKDLCLENEE
jgi:hypothetical protein